MLVILINSYTRFTVYNRVKIIYLFIQGVQKRNISVNLNLIIKIYTLLEKYVWEIIML